MNQFADYANGLLARLTPGAPATVSDNPAAGPPVILVDLFEITGASGVGAHAALIPIKCIVAPPGDLTARRLLEDMVAHVFAVLGTYPAASRTYRPNETTQVPMYEITYSADIPNPNC